MKKYFIMAAAVLASLTACQKNTDLAINDGSIKFVATPTTRATDVTTVDNLGGFSVLGFVQDTELFNTTTTKSGSEYTTDGVTKYWADNTEYNFFAAYSPKAATQPVLAGTKASASFAYTNAEGADDLVFAGLNMTSTTASGQLPAVLTFKHALSRVKFQFANGYDAANNVLVEVADVKILGRAGETATATVDNAGNITWTAPTAGTGAINFEFINGDGDAIAATPEGTDYQYLIPNAAAQYKLACVVKVWAKNGEAKGNLIHEYNYSTGINIAAAPTAYAAGQSYVYTMTVLDALNPIQFSVTVEPWATDQTDTVVFPK